MATNYNPRIVTDGLVLALDAGNNKSHSTNRFISYGSGLVTENVTFSLQGTGTFQRVAAGTVIGGYTVKTTDVVYSYALGVSGCHYHGNTVSVPAGVYATFTFDYLVTGATTYPINDYLANIESSLPIGAAIGTANSLQNVWQRRSFTTALTASSGTFNAYLYPGACGSARLADSGTIYYRNPRVEFSSVDTGTGNFSSMSNLTTWYNLNNGTNNGTLNGPPYQIITDNATGTCGYMSFDGTDDYVDVTSSAYNLPQGSIELWVNPNAPLDNLNQQIFARTNQTNGTFNIFKNTTNLYQFSMRISTDVQYSIGSDSTATTGWTHIVGTYDGTIQKLFVNSVQQTTTNSISGTLNTAGTLAINIARQTTATSYFNGKVSSVKLYNRALTAAEVQQNYSATRLRFLADGSSAERAAPNAAYLVSLGITQDGNYWYKPPTYTGSAIQLYTNFSNAPAGKGYVLVARGRESTDWWNTNGQNTSALTSTSLDTNTPIAVLPNTFVNGLINNQWSGMRFITNRRNSGDSWLFVGSTSTTFSWTYFQQSGSSVSASAQKYSGLWLSGSLALNWASGIYWTDTLNYGGGNDCDRTFTWSWGGHGVYQGWSGGSTCTPAGSFQNTTEGHGIQLVNCYVEC